MSTSRRRLPAELSGRSFTLAEGRAAGLSERELSQDGLRRPTRGVRSAAPRPAATDVLARCRELLPVLPPDAVFSHGTALDLLGIDRPRGLRRPDEVHIVVPTTTRRPRRAGVISHSRSGGRRPVLLREGLPVIPVDQLWLLLAAELSGSELVVLGDAMLRRRAARSSLGELGRAVGRLDPGARGQQRLRRALPLLRAGTDSCQESRLRLAIVDAGLPCPEVNRPVVDSAGRFVAMPDLIYREHRIAIEYDGDVHRTEIRAWRRDIARRQALEHLGWRTITCTADDVRDPARALTWIRSALGSRVSRS